MDDIFKNAPITISIIDYLGKVENGVGLLLSMSSEEETYELAYWYNREGLFKLVPEDRLLDKLKIKDINEFEYINEFIYFIHNSIKDPDKILDEFLK